MACTGLQLRPASARGASSSGFEHKLRSSEALGSRGACLLQTGRRNQGLPRPPRTAALPARAFLPVTFVSAAARSLAGPVAGKLLLQRGGGAAAGGVPVFSLLLLAYSIGVTIYATRRPGHDSAEQQQEAEEQRQAPGAAPRGLSGSDRGLGGTASGTASGTVSNKRQTCKMCAGKGTISWEGKMRYDEHTCPRCLVSAGRRLQLPRPRRLGRAATPARAPPACSPAAHPPPGRRARAPSSRATSRSSTCCSAWTWTPDAPKQGLLI
jgi:hypothetical protein